MTVDAKDANRKATRPFTQKLSISAVISNLWPLWKTDVEAETGFQLK